MNTAWNFESEAIEYKGYTIEYNVYSNNKLTIEGFSQEFDSIDETKLFLDAYIDGKKDGWQEGFEQGKQDTTGFNAEYLNPYI